jgi:triosephosphate isomerase
MSDVLPLAIANHKANLTWDQLNSWFDKVAPSAASFGGTVIVCPSSPFLSASFQKISQNNLKLKLGSQDISQFEQGAYTGEVAASQIANLVSYSIIGHSERRRYFKEGDQMLNQKCQNALKIGITPIYCIQEETTPIPEGVKIVAYEPVFAIGTGNPDSPQDVLSISKSLKTKGDYTVIYGGSVSAQNAQTFISKDIIDGILVSTNSLDPKNFIDILTSVKF